MQGIIVKLISDDYTVLCNSERYICKCRGVFRNRKIKPTVGDNVIIDSKNKIIREVLKRRNELVRPPVSNIDQAFIITSSKAPDFSSNLLNKMLTIIEYNNIKPIICFTKLDLLDKNELEQINKYINYYKKIGYDVYSNNELEEIKKLFKNKISVFTGQTGAGKSTLLNRLDINLNLKTNEISKALGRGKHTTRHVELLHLYKGLVADTPGFSDISFIGMSKEDIRDNFIEFEDYKEKCKYRDCMHDKEDQCMVKEMVKQGIIIQDRYEDYINFINNGVIKCK